MPDPISRVLTTLELPQTRDLITGAELAKLLEVDPRTVQRYIAVTRLGLKTLRKALPIAIDVRERLFGPDGHPDGSLHQTLLELDRAWAARETK
jgi:hypothetical protein